MSEAKTKSCNLTEGEVVALLAMHGDIISDGDIDEAVERINYLNKRLKTFNEVEVAKAPETQATSVEVADAPSDKVGW